MAIVGIDLGTTNSLVAYWNKDKVCLVPDSLGNTLFPSVVGFMEENKVCVGRMFKEQLEERPEWTFASFKRNMGTDYAYKTPIRSYTAMELSAYVLSELKTVAENYLQEEIEEAIISVPAYFNDKQRSDTKKAAQIAGLKVERVINEPSAAALYYQLNCEKKDKNIIVFDFGGGTLDLSYVECFDNVIEIVSVAGDNKLGGDDIDKAIVDYICEQKGIPVDELTKKDLAILKSEVEDKKKSICSDTEIEISGVIVSEQILFKACIPLFEKIKKIFLHLLQDAGITISDIDDLIMVGGSSKLPVVKRFLQELLGKEPVVLGDTDKIVAMGLGAYAGIRERNDAVRDYVMTDVCPYTLGVESYSSAKAEKGHMVPMIERNSTLPCKKVGRFCTLYNEQPVITMKIYQGEKYFARENLKLGEVTIEVERKPAGEEWVDVSFTYDINGILCVSVTNSRKETKKIMLANQTLSEEEMIKYQEKMNRTLRELSPWEQEENLKLLDIVKAYYEESVGDRREQLGAILEWYVISLNVGRMKEVHTTIEKMKQIVDKLQENEQLLEDELFNGELKFKKNLEEETDE